MSHFSTIVLIPGDTLKEDIEATVAELLAPFDETIHVEEYFATCWCVGAKAQAEAGSAVNAEYDLDELRKAFRALPVKQRTEDRWEEMVKPRKERFEALLAEHPLKDKPNHQCERCGGIGERLTTYNPQSKWDFWSIGGRWDGWIFGPEKEKECWEKRHGGINLGSQFEALEDNCRPVDEIPIDDAAYLPFAVVTPDGEWHQQGQMGWWAIVSDPMNETEWHAAVKKLFAQYPDHLAITVDCHI